MNRVSGDYFESLLYTLFVSADERTTIEKLSVLLDIDIELVKVTPHLSYPRPSPFALLLSGTSICTDLVAFNTFRLLHLFIFF